MVLNDFNWEDHAFAVIHRYDPKAAKLLTQQSEYAFEMTNFTFGNESVESTFNFRNAIVKYLMHIHGVMDTYYRQEKVNKVLQQEHKLYFKKIMCSPDLVVLEDFIKLTRLTPEEKCHICILIMETKIRVELIYLTKALGQLLHI